MSQDKYTLKNKIANHLHFLTAQAFLFYFHCGAIPTLAPNARVAIFPVKHVSLHSITFITAILEESFIIGYAPCGSNWKPITLFSKSVFTLINKNVRELSLGNNEYTRDKDFLESLCHKLFPTRLISCCYFGSLVCFPCFKSVSYDFHCLILCKQTSNIIMIKILIAIMQYISIYKILSGVLLETRHFLFDLVWLMVMSRSCAYIFFPLHINYFT